MVLTRSNPELDARRNNLPIHDFEDWREQQSAFHALGAYQWLTMNLAEPGERPERVVGAAFTGNVFAILREQAILGRTLTEADAEPGVSAVVVNGYDLWQERYRGSRDVLGRTVRVNGVTRTIIGVMPEGFLFPAEHQLWVPFSDRATAFTREGNRPFLTVFGRIKDGVSEDEATSQLSSIAMRLGQAYPETNEGWVAEVMPYTKRFIGNEVYALLFTMLGAVLGVLLIASANVANLLLARAAVRTKEVAIRSALGASRLRVISQLLAEAVIIAGVGGALGLGLGYLGIGWFNAAISVDPPPFWITFDLDTTVLTFVIFVTGMAALVSGIVPALQASRADVNQVLNDEGRGGSSFRMGKFSSALVVTEIAVSCGLLVASGLMVKSVTALKTIDLPFTTENVFTARLNLMAEEYPDTASRVGFYEELLPKLEAIPGVEAATLSDGLPATGNGSRVFHVEGETYPTDRDYPVAREGIVTPGYFETFETRVLQGRAFTTSDIRETIPVAVVNESFVRSYLDGDAMGRRVRMGRSETTAEWITIVGVVPDMKMEGIDNDEDSPAGFYIPIAQSGVGSRVSIALRTTADPLTLTSAVQAKVGEIDPNLPIYDVLTMKEAIAEETWFYHTFGTLFMVFGVVALFLAAVGLYGVMSFAVTQRRTEMGVRMALGAQPNGLVGLVMRKGAIQLTIGMAIGMVLALLTAQPLELVLYGVNARDPMVFGVIMATLATTGLLASFIPARRVTKVDPATALHAE
jgi:predicted permease